MSSTDPTHLWRTPHLRARVPLPLYRSLLRELSVECVAYADLFDSHETAPAADAADASAPSNVLAHLKVDAEGADVVIVRAAMAHAARTCAWPWRVDFEAAHLHASRGGGGSSGGSGNKAAGDQGHSNGPGGNDGGGNVFPSAFTLSGFPDMATAGYLDPDDADTDIDPFARSGDRDDAAAGSAATARGEALWVPGLNGRFVRMPGAVGGAPAFAHQGGRWRCVFAFALGHWVVHDPTAAAASHGTLLDAVAAHTDAGVNWTVPWDQHAPWRALRPVPGPAPGGSGGGGSSSSSSSSSKNNSSSGGSGAVLFSAAWQRLVGTAATAEFRQPACVEGERSCHRREGADDAVVAIAHGDSGSSEGLVLELEDLGYACSCEYNELDCTCFTTPSRIKSHHPECAHLP